MMHAQDTETAGMILRKAREAGGRSLRDVANELNIRQSHLEAIEAGRHDRLPALAFSTGFVRSYARLLGLDAGALAAAWRAAAGAEGLAAVPELRIPEPVAESRLPGRSAIGLAGLGVFAIYFGWIADFGVSGYGQTVAPVPARLTSASLADLTEISDTGSAAAAVPSAPKVAAGPGTALAASLDAGTEAKGNRVELLADRDCWIRIVGPEGNEVWSGILKAGERWSPKSRNLRLMTSNAGVLRVLVDGEEMGVLGKDGAILRDVPLDPQKLRQRDKLAMR